MSILNPRISSFPSQPLRLALQGPRITRSQLIKPTPIRTMAAQGNSDTISKITEKEKEITGRDQPVKGGPTAQAQKHAGEDLNSSVISDITAGEKAITGVRVGGGRSSLPRYSELLIARGTTLQESGGCSL